MKTKLLLIFINLSQLSGNIITSKYNALHVYCVFACHLYVIFFIHYFISLLFKLTDLQKLLFNVGIKLLSFMLQI